MRGGRGDAYIEINISTQSGKQQQGKQQPMGRMKRPTPSELREYARSIGFVDFDAMAFIDYYGSIGWKIGKHPMVNWKLAVNTWRRKHRRQWRGYAAAPVNVRNKRINQLNQRKAQLLHVTRAYTAAEAAELSRIEKELQTL
jgi:hypothetical protein